VFAAGCFWNVEARFGAVDGVVRTAGGFAGTGEPPTYASIGDHVEAVRVAYDPDAIDYVTLLDVFWRAHDPSETPSKRRYQPALVPLSSGQAAAARRAVRDWDREAGGDAGVEVIDGGAFTQAALHHQKYKLRQHDVLFPAVRAHYPSDRAFAHGRGAALVNGYVAGHRSLERLEDDLPRLALSEEAEAALRTVARRHCGWRAFVGREAAGGRR
jgi:peptide-methionine (S)-S-oxide reductase